VGVLPVAGQRWAVVEEGGPGEVEAAGGQAC